MVAGALRRVDPVGARAAEQETNWRSGYLTHFRRLVEAGVDDPSAARQIARDGLATLHQQLRVRPTDQPAAAPEPPLAEAFAGGWPVTEPLTTQVVTGPRAVEPELSVPYRGERLRGAGLQRQLDDWVERGIIEPSCAEAVRAVAANPDWLDLSDLTVAVLGAGAEMGPVHALLRWGGRIAAVDLPRPEIWSRLLPLAGRYAGELRIPVRGDGELTRRAGANLIHDAPAVAQWLGEQPGRLVLGNYAYADGGTHVRVAAAADAVAVQLREQRPETALAFLATPTDVYAVPDEVVAHSAAAYAHRAVWSRPVRWLSAGRLLRRNYPPGADPGIFDCLVPQQGPNYALAKRVQRWRATEARSNGATVSLTVAPMTRTRSVVKNRALAAAYAGVHAFGVEVFDPATSNTLMAALLVHDLRNPAPPKRHPWQEEAAAAAHGGVWRVSYAPRSALGLAAVVGLTGARS
ncbi:hypothetical protein JQS43_13645 [Natronosporangium hydrolyticum]|uniref:Uncharacterized protein n=1 Tax=Natronosporangium hydrolyticum TaxID=2811111 RepID=A0A895YMX6_9ACTN|nr:hypothetical protein JQS43_13645 [Natronosporangium hydrolyticum]